MLTFIFCSTQTGEQLHKFSFPLKLKTGMCAAQKGKGCYSDLGSAFRVVCVCVCADLYIQWIEPPTLTSRMWDRVHLWSYTYSNEEMVRTYFSQISLKFVVQILCDWYWSGHLNNFCMCIQKAELMFAFVRATAEKVWRSLQSLVLLLKNQHGGSWNKGIWHHFCLFSTLCIKMFISSNTKWQLLSVPSTHVDTMWEQQVVVDCWYFLNIRIFQPCCSVYSIKRELLSHSLLVTVSCSQQ